MRTRSNKPAHIATYPKFIINAAGNATQARAGTGYIFTVEEIPALRARLEAQGHPLTIRWRTAKDRLAYEEIAERK